MKNMLGVVVTGGKSSRMGSDKGLMKTGNGTTWAQNAYFLLKNVCEEVVVSINPEQREAYQSIFDAQHLIPDNKNFCVKGPLLGLLSVHSHRPAKNILLLACDMIHMDQAVLEEMMRNVSEKNVKEAYVYVHNGNAEPLCSFFKAEALQRITPCYRTGELTHYSMKFLLEQLDTAGLPLPDRWMGFFTNVNTQDELKSM